jgi:hypothetical protein
LVNQSWDWDRRGQEPSGRRAVEAAGDDEEEEEEQGRSRERRGGAAAAPHLCRRARLMMNC